MVVKHGFVANFIYSELLIWISCKFLVLCLWCTEFSWEDVKVDKHRENYLGHSIKAPVGRWQKGNTDITFAFIVSASSYIIVSIYNHIVCFLLTFEIRLLKPLVVRNRSFGGTLRNSLNFICIRLMAWKQIDSLSGQLLANLFYCCNFVKAFFLLLRNMYFC